MAVLHDLCRVYQFEVVRYGVDQSGVAPAEGLL